MTSLYASGALSAAATPTSSTPSCPPLTAHTSLQRHDVAAPVKRCNYDAGDGRVELTLGATAEHAVADAVHHTAHHTTHHTVHHTAHRTAHHTAHHAGSPTLTAQELHAVIVVLIDENTHASEELVRNLSEAGFIVHLACSGVKGIA